MRVTAAGSVPGDDFRGALAAMTEALPDVLPPPRAARPGRGIRDTGRALGIIDGLGFDIQPAGWRLTTAPGADHRRARARWRHDLDDAEELLQGFDGVLKIGLAGAVDPRRHGGTPPGETGCWPITGPAGSWRRR